MKMKELSTKSLKELETMLADSRLKLRDLRFKDASHQLKDVRSIREARQLISRLLTLITREKNK